MNRLEKIEKFVDSAIGDYKSHGLLYRISLNDDISEDYTDFEVEITNTTNNKKIIPILRYTESEDLIELMLFGEDFLLTNEHDFVMSLFLNMFITYPEI